MAMTNEKVDTAYRALYHARCAAQLMQMDLRDSGDTVGAGEAGQRADLLDGQIKDLISRELQEWHAVAEALIPDLTQASQNAQSAVNQVERDVENAQKVGEAMQALDQVVTAAAKFLA